VPLAGHLQSCSQPRPRTRDSSPRQVERSRARRATPCHPVMPSPGPHAPPHPHAASWAAREEQTRSRPHTSPTCSPCSPHTAHPRARSTPPPQPASLRPPPPRSRWGASDARRSSYLCRGIRSASLAALVDALVAGRRCDIHVCAPESYVLQPPKTQAS
jgi:hypothetical protein